MSKKLPPALYNELISGLQMMLALRLSGSPAADTVAATAAAWEIALAKGRKWDEQEDRGRFQTGFEILAGSTRYWPAPCDLLDALPPRPEPLKLEYYYQKPTAAQLKKKDALVAKLTQTLTGKRRHLPKGNNHDG